MNAPLGRPVIINRSIVDPTPEGPRFAGIYRQTRIDGDTIEQIYYAEDADGKFGALVTRRVITRGGVTTEEIFDPPLAEHGITCAASHARCQGGDSGAGAGVVARLIQTRTDDD